MESILPFLSDSDIRNVAVPAADKNPKKVGIVTLSKILLQKIGLAYSRQLLGKTTISAVSGKWSEAIRARGERCTVTLNGFTTRLTKI